MCTPSVTFLGRSAHPFGHPVWLGLKVGCLVACVALGSQATILTDPTHQSTGGSIAVLPPTPAPFSRAAGLTMPAKANPAKGQSRTSRKWTHYEAQLLSELKCNRARSIASALKICDEDLYNNSVVQGPCCCTGNFHKFLKIQIL